MRVELSKRALADLEEVASYYRTVAGPDVASRAQARFAAVIRRLAEMPESSPRVAGRPGVRVAVLEGFPYLVFYRVMDGTVQIARIRHGARRPLGRI